MLWSYFGLASGLFWRGHFEKAAFSGTLTDLFGSTEFSAPDARFKTTNAGHPKNVEGIQTGKLAEGRTFLFDRKINK